MKIVAPAGSLERFYAAIKAGADEIYMGLKGFGARRNAVNLTVQEYKEAIDYAHLRGVRVFLTLNTIMTDAEIEGISINLRELYSHGLDAVIVQDFGMAYFISKNFPELELHASTQMTIANHEEINYLKSMGFKRVVLPRELSFEEIKSIREKTDIELEVFVSGALCISYSGNCYMSSFIGGRSGNRGMCAQPCRKKYSYNSKDLGYFLSPKDQMYDLDEINKLKEIGIDSIKLEGRMKEPNYVFEMVDYYRSLIRGEKRDEKASYLFNRGYSKGYFYSDERKKILNRAYAGNIGKYMGKVNQNCLELNEDLILGDGVTFLSEKYEKLGGSYINRIVVKGEGVSKIAKKGETVLLNDLPKGTKYLYRNYSKIINSEIEDRLKRFERRERIDIEIEAKKDEQVKVTAFIFNNNKQKIEVSVISNSVAEKAKKRAITQNEIIEKISELGESNYIVNVRKIVCDNDIFIPLSVLKTLKREMIENLNQKLIESYRRKSDYNLSKLDRIENKRKKLMYSAIVVTSEQKELVKKFGIDKIYDKGLDVAREGILNKIDLKSKLATNLYQVVKNKSDKVTVSWNMNISNRYSFEFFSEIENLETIIISPEISYKKIEAIGETKIKKAILGYGRLKAMYIELGFGDNIIIENEQRDRFRVYENNVGNSEIYFEKPLNILKDIKSLEEMGISEIVLDFSTSSLEEIKDVLKFGGEYCKYNYDKGVY